MPSNVTPSTEAGRELVRIGDRALDRAVAKVVTKFVPLIEAEAVVSLTAQLEQERAEKAALQETITFALGRSADCGECGAPPGELHDEETCPLSPLELLPDEVLLYYQQMNAPELTQPSEVTE
jgi:hypothetical protein